jgi:uncharacterized repeat protein (TIGR03847 family)
MDLGPVERITADAVGEPGLRVFYLQARTGTDTITVIVEKQQVQLLATSVMELLTDLELETPDPGEEDLSLLEPIEPRWRAGRLSIGYDQERDLFMLEMEEFRPDEDADEDAPPEPADPRSLLDHEPETLRLWASRPQMLALSRHGIEVAERGRPACQYCGNPMDPEGHACPAMNGHSTPA